MACYFPIDAFRSHAGGVTFTRKGAYLDLPIQLPCNQCIGCKLEKSRQWALRCTHEAQLYSNNSFITLTYNSDHLPITNNSLPTLSLRHFQLFIKRLRKKYSNKSIRFFHCGEYGDLNHRPHYHALLFNHDFEDKTYWKTHNDQKYYTSEALDALWTDPKTKTNMGFSTIGDLTFDSAAYVARYCLKKITGKNAEDHYQGRVPEYATMSRRPGIGQGWLEKYKSDVYPSGFIIHEGQKMQPPKYYDRITNETDERAVRRSVNLRMQNAKKHAADNTPARLSDRHKVHLARANLLKRDHDK